MIAITVSDFIKKELILFSLRSTFNVLDGLNPNQRKFCTRTLRKISKFSSLAGAVLEQEAYIMVMWVFSRKSSQWLMILSVQTSMSFMAMVNSVQELKEERYS
ncbi:hypothetical protein C1645_782549 [Glomus cerebriforme]|uniref:Uncharacterized protein n=1 Tax=Glomus cerebriforme TaxID=658196 RepID=A0A397SGK2_9GLOM|nr:hypothetical protein C1645_782549 [Glomus cerebriforme]